MNTTWMQWEVKTDLANSLKYCGVQKEVLPKHSEETLSIEPRWKATSAYL